MKLSTFASLAAMVTLAASPVMSTSLHRRHDMSAQSQNPVQRPITPAYSLSRYIEEAEKGVALLNNSLNESLKAGMPTQAAIDMNDQGTFILTSALGDAAFALRTNKIKKSEADAVVPKIKCLRDEILPIAEKVGTLKPFYDQFGPKESQKVAVSLQYLAGAFDGFYQALKAQTCAEVKQQVAGYVLEIICAIDAASTKLDSCVPLTDSDFCTKGKSDWDSLPHQCPGADKCSGKDIRRPLYATMESGCYETKCRDDNWCKKAEKQDLCKWTPSKWHK